MKKALLLAACGAIMAYSVPASADDHDRKFYLSAQAGAGWLSDADNKGNALDIKSDSDTGLAFAGAFGFRLNKMFRVEGEISYMDNDADSLTITNPGAFAGLRTQADGDVTTLNFMANGYVDFDLGDVSGGKIRPFLMGGLGVSKVDADISSNNVQIVNDTDTVFAYQAGAGLAYQATDTVAVDLSYRYFGTADPNLDDAAGNSFDSEYGNHIVMLGIRKEFE